MPLKIVHCADFHIGASFAHMGTAIAARREQEVQNTFSSVIEFCREKNADALLICGDLFDSTSPRKSDCEFVRNAFSSIADTNIYIICGNHDYMCTGSPFSKEDYFSENVHIFPCTEAFFEIPEKNAVIWGKSYSAASCEPSFANCIFDENKINIMCLHGDIAQGSDYNIISKNVLSSLPCNYAAFGHIHSGEIFNAGSVRCAYCGTPEGHSFNDCGQTGFIYAEIDKNEVSLFQNPSSLRKYRFIQVDITDKNDDEIISEAQKSINNTDFFRLTLTGQRYEKATDIAYIKKQLEAFSYYIDIIDESTPGFDLDLIEREESLRGAFLRELRILSENEEEFVSAAKIGLDALSGHTPTFGGAL